MRLKEYNNKRNFNKTSEPKGKLEKTNKLRFCVQHHIARRDHYDFRLEYNGVMLSWAIPKGPSYKTSDKRLSVHVEDHPISYRTFEGVIKEGYGKGTVMLWDIGDYKQLEPFRETYKKGYLKFELNGKRLKGKWTLVSFKDDNWLLIKEKDNIKLYDNILEYDTSVKSGKTMDEIEGVINISSKDKIIYKKEKITKEEVFDYYNKVKERMLPFLNNRLLSTVRCPSGTGGEKFFKKHFKENKYLSKKNIKNKDGKVEDYYYITDEKGLLSEVQMNSIEFHVGASRVDDINHPNMMVFDLDPDEKLSIDKVREGVHDLKKILDELKLKSYLKTSGGKGYHVVVPFYDKITYKKFEKISESIAKLMEQKYPDKYTTNIRKKSRTGKIFIDYYRNKKGSTSVCPYSLRARKTASVSMPIKWSELYKIKPDEITLKDVLKRLKRKDPWYDLHM